MKGPIDPVGGRYPTRQLLLQPEAVGAWWAGNGPTRSLQCRRSGEAGSASTQTIIEMNTEQTSKSPMWLPSLSMVRRRPSSSWEASNASTGWEHRGSGDGMRAKDRRVNTGSPTWREERSQPEVREEQTGLRWVADSSVVALERVMIVELRDLSSRATQEAARARRLM